MRIGLAILLLLAGVSYPIAALVWFNRRLAQQPAPDPRQVGRILSFNLLLPVSLILAGIGFLVPRLGSSLALQLGTGLAAMAALLLLVEILFARWQAGRAAKQPGRARSSDGR